MAFVNFVIGLINLLAQNKISTMSSIIKIIKRIIFGVIIFFTLSIINFLGTCTITYQLHIGIISDDVYHDLLSIITLLSSKLPSKAFCTDG